MGGARLHPVDAAGKAPDGAAPGDLPDELEQPWVIGQKMQRVIGRIFLHAEIRSDPFVRLVKKRGGVDLTRKDAKESRFENRGQPDATVPGELPLQPFQVFPDAIHKLEI